MQPIISPWLFYFVDLLPKIQSACGLLFCLGIMITFFAFMIDKDKEIYTNDTWVTRTDEKLAKMQWRGICTGISMLVVCGLGMIFIPDQDTVYKMIIASYITPDNINAVVDSTGALVDRGVSYIGEISKSGLQTLMQSIVETARELKNL